MSIVFGKAPFGVTHLGAKTSKRLANLSPMALQSDKTGAARARQGTAASLKLHVDRFPPSLPPATVHSTPNEKISGNVKRSAAHGADLGPSQERASVVAFSWPGALGNGQIWERGNDVQDVYLEYLILKRLI